MTRWLAEREKKKDDILGDGRLFFFVFFKVNVANSIEQPFIL